MKMKLSIMLWYPSLSLFLSLFSLFSLLFISHLFKTLVFFIFNFILFSKNVKQQDHDVTIIHGDTGCGKSTQIPQVLLFCFSFCWFSFLKISFFFFFSRFSIEDCARRKENQVLFENDHNRILKGKKEKGKKEKKKKGEKEKEKRRKGKRKKEKGKKKKEKKKRKKEKRKGKRKKGEKEKKKRKKEKNISNSKNNFSVLISIPRRVAVVSLACRVAFEMHSEVGDHVGYEIGQQVHFFFILFF